MKNYISSAILGVVTGIIGVFIMGFLMAIAIPGSFFEWFKDNLTIWAGLTFLDVLSSFIAFGLCGIVSGVIIGKYMKNDWRINALIYYLAYLLYLTFEIMTVFSFQQSLQAIFSNIKQTHGLPLLVLPLCVIFASYISRKRRKKLRRIF